MPTIYNDSQDPTGFVDGSNINVSYDWTNRTITLTGNLSYYWRGVKKTLTSPWTSTGHTATVGSWYLSTSDGTNFTWAQTPWLFSIAQVSYVYYQSTSAATYAIRETHSLMPWQVHEELHDQIGTYLDSGGKATTGTYSIGVSADYATAPGFDAAVIQDEDNQTNIDTLPGTTGGTYMLMYIGLSGSSQISIYQTNNFPFTGATNVLMLVNNTTTGTLVVGTNNRWFNVYQILVPVTSDSNSQRYRMLFLQPQVVYTSLIAAQSEDTRGLVFGDLANSSVEFVI
jgi:hypothetical protein